jgi:hypothetical protein
MNRRQKVLQDLLWLGYFLGLGVLRAKYGRADWLGIINLLIGGGLGWILIWVERLVYIYWSHTQTQVAQYARYHFSQRHWRTGLALLEQRQAEIKELGFRSALFQVVWVGLAVFVLSSTSSSFGQALVMGLGLHILVDEWQDFLSNKRRLKTWLFWQIKREISDEEMSWFVYAMTGVFALLTWLWF